MLIFCFSALASCNNDNIKDNTGNAKEPLRAKPVAAAPPPGELIIDEDGTEYESLGVEVVDSYSDGIVNYYIVKAGHIQNTHIATTNILYYNGVTPITSTTVTVTEKSIGNKLVDTATSSSRFASSSSSDIGGSIGAGVSIETEVGFIVSMKQSFEFLVEGSFNYTSSSESENESSSSTETSFEKIITTAVENSTSFTVGENGEKAGWYRYGLYAVADLYYVINTSLDNKELIGWSTSTCVRSNSILPYLEYSENGKFDNAPNINDIIMVADEFWTKLPLPKNSLADTYKRRFSAGENHSLWIDTSGQLWAFGYNGNGQLGDGSTSNRTSPVQIKAGQDNDITRFRAVSAGGNHSLAIDADGNLWAWGYNAYGQLGDGTTSNRVSPVNILPRKEIVAISAGVNHSMAIDGDGNLWTWGYNSNGQLGNGLKTISNIPVQIKAGEDDTVTKFKSISAGGSHSFAIDINNQLWAFGKNMDGQLGDFSGSKKADYPTPVQIAMRDGFNLITTFTSVSAGTNHSLIIDSNNSLWACGDNSNGQVGSGDTETLFNPYKVNVGEENISKFRDCSAGSNFSYVIDNQGTVWSFGINSNGQLGLGVNNTSQKTSPETIFRSDIKFAAVSAGANFGLAVDAEGDIWSWGYNGYGQLGIGNSTTRHYSWVVYN
jgi:alpha-tubulin suppressor-like RCC1 family protein